MILEKHNNYVTTCYEKMDPGAFIADCQIKLDPNNPESKKLSVVEFFEVVSEINGISNLDMTWMFYDDLEKALYKDEYASKKLPYIKPGTTLEFPMKDYTLLISEISKSKQFLSQSDFSSYWSTNLNKLIHDPDYVPDNIVAYDEELSVNSKVQPLNIRVWIYCKAIDSVIDISQYIIDCNTDKTHQNGSFSFSSIAFKDASNTNIFGSSYWERFNTVSPKGYCVKNYLEKVVQINDIVFIRFERLKLEKERDSEVSENIFVSPNKLANTGTDYNVWDMIGFVDSVNSSYSAEENLSVVSIQGRDITKLFEEDGSYFIPLVDVENTKQRWIFAGRPQDSWYKRNIITGSYDFIWSYSYKSINEVVWFVINIMSNIGICKNDLFKSWKDKRTEKYSVEGQNDPIAVNGIWQIVKCNIDPSVMSRVLIDSSIGNPNGTLMAYIQRACQYPFVEFMTDTYINTIDIVVRQPPFTESAIMGSFSKGEYITITPDNLLSCSLSYDSRIYSWFQISIQNNQVFGDSQQTNLAFVPIIYLNEYAELWGNRKLEVNDIYSQLATTEGTERKSQFVTMQAALLNDLIYLVESNAYLPFTRIGTIEINGDRRIKAGTFVLNQATDEFFYVLSVSNSMSFSENGIDRRTILQVERGMYVPILEGTASKSNKRLDNSQVKIEGKPSYFKIVNLERLKASTKEAEGGKLTTAESPPIDKAQFDYFLNRKMFGGLI